MEIKLIIYDLDGTLVDSAPDLASAVNAMRKDMGFPPQNIDDIKQWVGNGAAMLVKRALADALKLTTETIPQDLFQQASDLFFTHYRNCNGNDSKLYAGVLPALQQIQTRGIQQAVCTNKPTEFTDVLLKKMQIDHFFNCIVSGDTLPQKKPDPSPLLFGAAQCKVPVEHCLMIGDSMTDVLAACNANMRHVCVSYGYNRGENLSKVCNVISNLFELTNLF